MGICLFPPTSLIAALLQLAFVFSPRITEKEPIALSGFTMGTTWEVIYFDQQKRNLKSSIDSLLTRINEAINYYDTTSEVSKFNRSTVGIPFRNPHLKAAIEKARQVHAASGGAFDLTVMPLVNAWGFGPGKNVALTSNQVDSIRAFVGFEKIKVNETSLEKTDPRIQLDFGGIGQGYAVDVIVNFLRLHGIDNFLVELGGEGFAYGRNISEHRSWQIGILDPNSTRDEQLIKLFLHIENQAFTTSGNYFNYRIVNGRKVGHTLNPRSGYPVENELLSASVFASDCASADAWATAFMVMGLEKSVRYLKNQTRLEAILLYAAPEKEVKVFATEGIKQSIIPQETQQ
jgi:FAD:protein FMN transferase